MFYNMTFKTWLTNGWYYVRFYFKSYLTNYFKKTQNNPIKKDGYNLVFSDEFDQPIDWEKWKPCEQWGCTRELVIFKQNQVSQNGSDVILTSDLNNVPDEPKVKSGGLYSWNSLNTTYGYFETREKLTPRGITYWPAFWLSSSDSWPPEIDVFELVGDNSSYFTMSLHWRNVWTNGIEIEKIYNKIYEKYGYISNDFDKTVQFLQQPEWTVEKQKFIDELDLLTSNEMISRRLKFPKKDFLSQDYHIYACKWDFNKVIWYIDNLPVYVLDKHVPDKNMFVLINNGSGTNNPIPEQFPMNVYCDYFRYYSLS